MSAELVAVAASRLLGVASKIIAVSVAVHVMPRKKQIIKKTPRQTMEELMTRIEKELGA